MRKNPLIATLFAGLATLALASPAAASEGIKDPIKIGPKTHDSPISLYQGRKYKAKHNRVRLCIRKRESNNDYRAVSRTGRYRGAYQFSPELAKGAAWMIQKELIKTGTPKQQARWIGKRLREHSMNKWAPFWQDFGFWLVYNNGRGAFHWKATVPGTACGSIGYHS